MRGSWFLAVLSVLPLYSGLAQPVQNTPAEQWSRTAERFSDTEAYDSALYYFHKAKENRAQAGDWPQVAMMLSRIFGCEALRENYGAAQKVLSETLKIIADKKITDIKVLSYVYNEASTLHYSLGDYELAIQYMKQSLAWYLKNSKDADGKGIDPVELATSYSNIGSILNRLGDYDEAILNFEKSLVLYMQKDPSSMDVADAHTSLSVAFYRKRNYRQAIAHGRMSLKIFDRLKGQDLTRQYINGYNAMAVSHAAIGEYVTALDFLNRALRQQRTSEYMIARTHHNLGYVYLLMNNHPQALRYLRLAIRENRAKYGDTHPDIGKAYRQIGIISTARNSYDSALLYYQRALTTLVPGFTDANITANPSIAAGINAKPDLLRTLNDKGKTLYRLASIRHAADNIDYLKTAHQTFQTAMELLELMRGEYELEDSRQFINEDAMPVYNHAMQAAMALYTRENNNPEYLEAAFSISERSRALMLLESLQYRESKALLGVPDTLLLREKTLKRHLAYYENRITEAAAKNDSAAVSRNKEYLANNQQAYRTMTEVFKAEYPGYYNSKFISPVSLKTLQKTLPDAKTALLEYFVGEERIYSIVATQNQCIGYSIPKPPAIDSVLWLYRRSISDISWILSSPKEARIQYVKTARTLHDLFIRPVVMKMSTPISHLVIVPQGGFDQISFDALLTEYVDKDANNYKDLPYLFRKYTIQQAYSATAYCKLKGEASRHTAVSCLAFAPGFSGTTAGGDTAPVMLSTLRGGQQALPGTQKEIDRIAKYFDGKLYRGTQATEINFKKEAGTYPIIHLATHGLANHEMPGRSHLLFFSDQDQDTTEDNTLFAYEIANLSLQADLVVLSGCETGFGIISRGEGIMSLGRSFIHAGSKSVLTSLWKVDDEASAHLMSQFYAALADGQSKPEAMNNARQAYLAQTDEFKAHPFFWAAFTFTGDDRPMRTGSNTMYYLVGVVVVIAGAAWVYFRFQISNSK